MSITLVKEEGVSRWKLLLEATQTNDLVTATELVSSMSADDRRRILAQLDLETREKLCEMLEPELAADLMADLTEEQSVEILEEMPAELAADVLEEMPADVSGDLLRELDDDDTDAILAEIDDTKESAELRERANYADNTAGALMSDQVLSFVGTTTVYDVLRKLGENTEKYSDADVQYFYVTSNTNHLKGVLALRTLVLGGRDIAINELMIPEPLAVSVTMNLEDLEDVFETKKYLGFPVIDAEGRLKGIVTREHLNEALAEVQTESFLKSRGIVGGEELRSMPLRDRCFRRLAWLGPNIVLNLAAASVIAAYEDTLQSVIALAIFLPMVSDMSGCSGNQAVAVSIRELTLGIIRPKDYMRIIIKEGLLGIFNGAVLGVILGVIAALWKDNIYLGLVIGSALTINTIISVTLGGLIPLVLKRFKADPALASSPILTTCTDMCGFFLVLSLANTVISRL
ncbi:magnesium transporter [Akkermansiaceae bacterium]|nr:magnesium transporter [Akkermansiaceae bacterium]